MALAEYRRKRQFTKTPEPTGSASARNRPAAATSKRRSQRPLNKLVAAEYPLALATLVKEPPQGKQWLHEMKFDGYRLLALVEARGNSKVAVRLLTRNQLDWSHRYPAIAKALSALPVAVIDGELVALDDAGISRFQLLQNAAANRAPLVYYAFDLLHLEGDDLRTLPLTERKDRLRTLLTPIGSGPVRYSDHMTEHGAAFLAECCRRGLEGIICKRADRPYPRGRTLEWLKIKCLSREELVIGGYTDSTAAGRPWGALVVGYFEQGGLVYAGRVGTGFDTATLKDLHRRLIELQRADSPFAGLPARERGLGAHWVRPELVAQVEFHSWTDTGILRQASFQGLREDKPALSVGRPESLKDREPTEINMQPRKKRGKAPGAKAGRAKAAGAKSAQSRAAKSASRSASSRKRLAVGTSAVALTVEQRVLTGPAIHRPRPRASATRRSASW